MTTIGWEPDRRSIEEILGGDCIPYNEWDRLDALKKKAKKK